MGGIRTLARSFRTIVRARGKSVNRTYIAYLRGSVARSLRTVRITYTIRVPVQGLAVIVPKAPRAPRNTALPYRPSHDVVASVDNAQRRCALSGENPVQRAFSCQKFYVP